MEKIKHVCWLLQKPTVHASLLQSPSCFASESQSIVEQLMLQSNNLAISLSNEIPLPQEAQQNRISQSYWSMAVLMCVGFREFNMAAKLKIYRVLLRRKMANIPTT